MPVGSATRLRLVKGLRGKSRVHHLCAGELIPDSGIYTVFHSEHRFRGQVTLISGELFPRCTVCGPDVHFRLLRFAPEAMRNSELNGVRLYEIPHPDREISDVDKIIA